MMFFDDNIAVNDGDDEGDGGEIKWRQVWHIIYYNNHNNNITVNNKIILVRPHDCHPRHPHPHNHLTRMSQPLHISKCHRQKKWRGGVGVR